ncbi:MAG: PVC-type heme-binding CxxCH protein [Pirellulaceae bacterium]|nr:PVC-type heme-binding CxxCH protein [Pirellulaceae bacterium]
MYSIPHFKAAIAYLLAAAVMLGTSATSPRANAEEFAPLNTQPNGEAPLSPQDAIKYLSVPEGFQITLAAAEPDVQQPIAIAFDDRGRLWVAESYSYDGSTFTDEPYDRIIIFDDTNGDGVLDQRRIFCDGLTHLTGLQIGFGGVWITAPPHLSFIPDRDRDDVPDGDAIIHLDGWSLKAEHNSVNGLTWGHDGWLYGRHGIKQPSHVGRPGEPSEKSIELSCCIWRYHPTRHTFEVVADGTINPWGLDFNDHGQGFLTTSVVDHLWHLVPGAHYQRWKDRGVHPDPRVYEAMSATSDHLHWASGTWEKTEQQANGILDFGGGHSHCDAMIYLGDRWPESFRGALFTSNIHGRRINRDRLVQVKGEYRGVHDEDFLVASDPWFRAVSMEYGPDGDVYMTDWSDNGECHDRDGIHRTSGRIYKITWGDPVAVNVDLSNASSEQLVVYQLHRNDWYVRHARQILQERAVAGQDLSVAHVQLRSIFEENHDVTRKLRAMWALYTTGGIDEAWLVKQLSHESDHVQAWAVRLLVDHGDPTDDAVDHFAAMAQSELSWIVRMGLASALQRVPIGKRWEASISLAKASGDLSSPNLERMIWYAIEPEVAAYPQRAVQVVEAVSPRMRRWIARRITEDSTPSVAILFDKISQISKPEAVADLLDGFNDALVSVKIDQLPRSVGRIVTGLIEHKDARVRVSSMTAAAAVGDEATLQRVRSLLHDATADLQTRHAALTGLVRRKPPGFADDLKRLLLNGELTESALQAATAIHDTALQKTIVNQFALFNKHDRIAAIDCLVARPSSAKLLIDAIEQKKIVATELSAGQARQIVALADNDLLQRFEQVWGSARPTPADRLQLIKTWQRALDPSRIAKADLENGHLVFQKTCANCHKLFDEGRTIGPDLTGANRRNLGYLLTNVIDPSATVPVDFQLTNVLTVDGRVVSGIISQRSESAITIQTATESIQIKSEDIDTIKVSPVSMMPDGLLDKLSENQVRDLFAWTMSDGLIQIANQ